MTSSPLSAETRGRKRGFRFAGVPVWGLVSGLAVLVSILVAHPYAEVGISDDFSYIRIAQVLAQTGHIVYTGWVTPILGWQLYLAAGFIKLFGFSFTTTRASIMFVAVVTAILCQRTFVRAGINDWNASIGTLTLMLSPLVVPLEVTYMTDIPGLFATILCLYACIRAIQSGSSGGAMGWIAFAALSNVVFGSSRQIAWLGVLVMVPSALWLLPQRRRVVVAGVGLWALSAALVFGINYWFNQQPYIQTEPLLAHRIGWHFLKHFSDQILRGYFETVLFLLPVLLIFLPALWRKRHPWQVYLAGSLFVLGGLSAWGLHDIEGWFAPYLVGVMPFLNLGSLRPVFTIAVLLCILALLTVVLTRTGPVETEDASGAALSNRAMGTLLLPFVVAYVGLIAPRAGFEGIWDRYLMPLLFIAMIFLFRFYQQWIGPRLPVVALLLVLCNGAYATATSHDLFAMYRARAAAVNEILAAGVPATSVSGGWDYDGWTELQLSSHIIDRRMRVPAGVTLPTPTHYGLANCPWFYCDMFPHVVPRYTISFRPAPIPGRSFPPVPYKTWIFPARTVYVVPFPDRSVDGQVP